MYIQPTKYTEEAICTTTTKAQPVSLLLLSMQVQYTIVVATLIEDLHNANTLNIPFQSSSFWLIQDFFEVLYGK